MTNCSICGKPLRADNKSGMHSKCDPNGWFNRIDSHTARQHNQERGDPEQWKEAAKQALLVDTADEDLTLFGFSKLPSISELKRKYKQLLLQNHPDQGGDHDVTLKIIEAYTNVKERLRKKGKK
jgi:hypothetical protein